MYESPAPPFAAPAVMSRLGSKELFPDVAAKAFLNFAAIGPPSKPVLDAVSVAMRDYAAKGAGAILGWVGRRNALRIEIAKLIKAQPHEIGLVTSTTQGIIDIAFSLPWKAGDG